MIRRLMLSSGAAAMLLSWFVLTRYAEAEADLQPHFLARPLLVVLLLSAGLALVSLLARSCAVAAALVLAGVIIAPHVAVLAGAMGLATLTALRLLRLQTWDLQRPALIVVAVLWTVSAGRAALATETGGGKLATLRDNGSPTYLILVDGYPNPATMTGRGVDLKPFISELEARGFDLYPDARTPHLSTRAVLTEMFNGMTAPAGFALIDSPIGHVRLDGHHLGPDVVSDFEVDLIGRSAAPVLAPAATREVVAAALRRHFDESLTLLSTTDEFKVFAHLLAPHAPFILDGEPMPNCWPGCQPFNGHLDQLGITAAEWNERLARQLDALNGRLLTTIDAIIERRPDAVIVLFSDHGMHPTHDPDALRRIFLAGRTPDRPMLFEDEPTPAGIVGRLP